MHWKMSFIAAVVSAYLPFESAYAQVSINDVIRFGAQMLEMQNQGRQDMRQGETIPRQQQQTQRQIRPSTIYDDLSVEEKKDLQSALSQLGHYNGAIDGQFGRGSRAAAASFQQQTGAQPTGYLTHAQIQKLLTMNSTYTYKAMLLNETIEKSTKQNIAGVPTREGAVLLGVQVEHTIMEKLGGGDADAYETNTDRFGRLLILAGKPELLDAPATTEFFMPLIEVERLRPYLTDMDFKLAKEYGRGHLRGWRGENQFAQEDTRLAFLAAFRSEILSQVPKLPLRIDMVRSVKFGKYDGNALALNVSSNSVWPHYGMLDLEAPEPSSFPTSWTLNSEEARRVVEAQSKAPYDGPVLVTRAEISGARAGETNVTLDIAALDMKIYSNAEMTRELGTLPLPPGAVTIKSAQSHSMVSAIPFDPVLIRMLVAIESKTITETAGFKYETFRMRRMAEERIRTTERMPPVDWPRLIAPSLIGTNTQPTQADISKIDRWFTEALGSFEGNASITGFCSFDPPSTTCNLPDDKRIALAKVVERAIDNWSYGWNGLPDDFEKIANQAYPGNAGLIAFGAGQDIPGVVVLKAHEAWYRIDTPIGPFNDAVLDVTIRSHKILGTPSGKGFVAVEIEPVAFRYLVEGEWRTIEIPPPQKQSGPLAGGTHDILGVKLGMPLAKAEEIIAEYFSGREVLRSVMQRDVNSSPADPILGVSSSFRFPASFIGSFLPDPQGSEAINLFYDTSQPDHPVIAVGRSIRVEEGITSEQDQKRVSRPIADNLVKKYGEPDRAGRLIYNDKPFIWAVDPVAKTRIKAGDDYCALDNMMARAFENSSMFYADLIAGDCGELVGAWLGRGVASIFLVDTSAIFRLREHYLEEASRIAAEKGADKPKIKF